MTSAYETFVKRVGDWADQKGVWYNEDESDLESLINNPKKYLKQYDDICIFTTLNKIFNPYSEQKFQDLLRIAIEDYGFVWCWNRDEGDYAGFDSEEHQSFEAGTGKTKGAGINENASISIGGSQPPKNNIDPIADINKIFAYTKFNITTYIVFKPRIYIYIYIYMARTVAKHH